MSRNTWIMMLAILALNWGGFVGALLYGMRRDARFRDSDEQQ